MLVMLMVVFFNRQFKVSYFYGDPHTFHRNPGCQNLLQNEFHNLAHIATILHAKSCHNIPVEFAHQKNITKKIGNHPSKSSWQCKISATGSCLEVVPS